MSHIRQIRIIAFILIIALAVVPLLGNELVSRAATDTSPMTPPFEMLDDVHTRASDLGIPVEHGSFLIVELTGNSIPSRGLGWSQILNTYGIPNRVCTITEIEFDPSILSYSSGVLLDASIGSDEGVHIPSTLIEQLVAVDLPTILTGRAAWLLHLLRVRGPPSQTAPSSTSLLTTPGLEGAVFLTSPIFLTIGAALTSESSVLLPNDPTQTERSRLTDLTGRESQTHLASLRYESWPLDLILYSPEDPTQLTAQGAGLLVNIIAYSRALRENAISEELASHQATPSDTLSGGFGYVHEPTMQATYFSVRAMKSLLTASEWNSWKMSRSAKVHDILQSLYVDYGSESAFKTSVIDGVVNLKTTAQGLWLASVLDLAGLFSLSEIVSYLSSRQDVTGHFGNHITTTYYVAEALNQSGSLGSINPTSLETWLRSCIIDGSKTSNPDLWGAVAADPASTSPSNEFAAHYVLALRCLGAIHNDPLKLTQWISTRTSNGDGSFNNTLSLSEELVIGTASAVTTLALLGTLTPENTSSVLGWFADNQQRSGGFGLEEKYGDIVAKTEESYTVAKALQAMDELGSSVSLGLCSYFELVETPVGFEIMEPLPTLMWSYWMSVMARQNHALGASIMASTLDYPTYFSQWTQYPFWNNLTAYTAPEYGVNQYRIKSVWSQLFGMAMSQELGFNPGANVISDAVSYIIQSQYVLGHFRPALFSGTAHMQHTVAAVEALYLMDSLDSIYYRAALESSILSEYSSGTWDMTGWSLRPFGGHQSAIDWLCTRAALRLGLIDATMAQAIASQIEGRIQYGDLWLLSYDVATLALLNSSGFAVDLESVDSLQVIASLGPTPFQSGWFNSDTLYQPIFSASVLDMVSILGVRIHLYDVQGSTISASSSSTGMLGSSLSIEVDISSAASSHDVLVNAFGKWMHFGNVSDSDILSFSIPDSIESLGHEDVFIQVDDWGVSKSFVMIQMTITGTLQGGLTIDNPVVTIGELVNGFANWNLGGGLDAGYCNVSVRLGDPPTYQQWNYESTSPFGFEIPTSDFVGGWYNLTIVITHDFCEALVLQHEVHLVSPEPTYLVATSILSGMVDGTLFIPWSLHLVADGSVIENQLVELVVVDEDDEVIHTDSALSSYGGNNFLWTPSQRGNLAYVLFFSGNGSLTPSEFEGVIEVYEDTQMIWTGIGLRDQYSSVSFEGQLLTGGGVPIADETVQIVVISPTSAVVMNTYLVSNTDGYIGFDLELTENGNYSLEWAFASSGFLIESSGAETITSWSPSYLHVGGIPSDALVGTTWNIWAELLDDSSNPIIGQPVTLRVILLPSTVVYEQSAFTNSSGFAVLQWTSSSAGSYHLEGLYFAMASRGSGNDILSFEVRIPIVLTISNGEDPSVGIGTWIQVTATDHTNAPVSNLYVTVFVRSPSGETIFSDSGITVNGAIYFSWIPSLRGLNNLTATSGRQGYYEAALDEQIVGVWETPTMFVSSDISSMAPSSTIITIIIQDTSGMPISGVAIQIDVLLNTLTLIDDTETTNSEGLITCTLNLSEPGALTISVLLPAQGWLLEASRNEDHTILGATILHLTTPGQPVEQGTAIAILATLTAWNGQPLSGAQVSFRILRANGTLLASALRTTGENGICTMAFDFDTVGDFIINVTYTGQQLNASASGTAPQRVYVTPSFEITHSPSCLLGESLQIQLGLLDAFGNRISGRTLLVEITVNSVLVFEAQIQTDTELVSIGWSPLQRGQASIEILHAGDVYYYTNMTQSFVSVLEHVTGTLVLLPSVVDLFDSAVLSYTLTASDLEGVSITLEVLGVDLVPLWSTTITTNVSGMADAVYTASHAHGILMVRARVNPDQYLIGGDVQRQLNVNTECDVALSMEPEPPCAGETVNITVHILDELGQPLSGFSVTISLFDPMGEQVKLGTFTKSVTVQVVNGQVRVPFTPAMTGLYTIGATSTGAVSVHAFTVSELRTVYSPTAIVMLLSQTEIEVGDMITIDLLLVDYAGAPMVGRNVTIQLDGPGSAVIGPVELTTNNSGHAAFTTAIGLEGIWVFEAVFSGLGVYLPATTSEVMNVRYGTIIESAIVNGLAIAGQSSIALTVLLADSGGTPLEGFTIHYAAYHDLYGLLDDGTIIQQGQDPMLLELNLDRMGNYTILLTFDGTTHYHPSMGAESVQVLGTTAVSFNGPSSIDRADSASIVISFLDETSSTLALSQLIMAVELIGPEGSIDLDTRISYSTYQLQLVLDGLPIGQYQISVEVSDSSVRIGTSASHQFEITSQTSIVITEEHLSGILSHQHSLLFVLEDSLHELISSQVVYVSIYNPEGREIYGSPLTERTAMQTTAIGTEVKWSPSLVGEYTIVLSFDGADYLNLSRYERELLVRYLSIIDVSIAEQVQYGDNVAVSISLTGGITKLQNMPVTILVTLNGETQQQFTVTTGSFGRADFGITGLFSGNHTIAVIFDGTTIYAPVSVIEYVIVEPAVILDLRKTGPLYVGSDCSVNLTVSIMGVSNEWEGTLDIGILSPSGILLGSSSFAISRYSSRILEFNALEAGSYYINCTASGLPVVGTENHLLPFTVDSAPLIMELDAGTAPVVGGVSILVIIGVVFWRRLDGLLGVLPTDWTG
ncbi:MAG: hypothetical protein EAX95_07155 [Candidatus Thorarchaeota archaeon]|nr:hypothetical protein [Candidatus Thorarchaeota archaeon]